MPASFFPELLVTLPETLPPAPAGTASPAAARARRSVAGEPTSAFGLVGRSVTGASGVTCPAVTSTGAAPSARSAPPYHCSK